MPFPILPVAGGALALLFLGGKKKPVAAPTSMPIPERMAHVLATNDPNAIRFEAGRLRQEGHPTEATELERAAAVLESEIAAGKRPAPVYPQSAPSAAPTGPLTQPLTGPLPAGAIKSPGIPQAHPVAPGVVLPLPLLGAGEVLHFMPPPASYDPRVQAWQTKLLSLGISVGPDGADGKFGDHTRTATTSFQKMANAEAAKSGASLIGVNGMLDAPTLARAALVFPVPKPAAGPKAAPAPRPPAKPAAAPVPVMMPAPQLLPPMPMPMPMQPQQPIAIPMPGGGPPIVLPLPPPMPAPVVVQTPAGPMVLPQVSLPQVVPAPALPVLAAGELLSRASPGQTYSQKTLAWQNKLVSLGLMQPKDAIGQFGPTTEAATQTFQRLASLFLAAHPIMVGATKVSKLTVDGKVGAQTLAAAAHAHAPVASGGAAAFSGYGGPVAASPLPGVIPAMMPEPINPRIALAARLLLNLHQTSSGHEDRVLVAAFQAQEGLRASGYYQPGTALALAKLGMVPPPPRYWPATGRAKAKRNYAREILRFAGSDQQRREEWERAAAAA